MSLALSPVIGTICVQPLVSADEPQSCDDSTLGLVLQSFAHTDVLTDQPGELRLVASTRLSRLTAQGDPALGVRANLAQLLEDLQAEYDQLAERLEG